MTGVVLMVAVSAVGVAGGLGAWTLTEYVAHRFTMHSTGGRGPAAKEHLMHHAQPARTRPFIRTFGHLGMYTAAVVIGVVLSLVMPLPWAVALAIGWGLGYTAYEGLHFAAHHHEPRGEWDLRLRRRHFHHHFAQPKTNLGVMFAGWDVLIGTNVEPDGPVKVPRRLAMSWLIDSDGAVRPEYADQYVIVGRRERSEAQDADDIERAFADETLALD